MRERFGREHPNTLFCVMNLANATADRGDLPLVLETEQRLATQLTAALGPTTPRPWR